MNIRSRIHFSFFILVSLIVIFGIVNVITNNRALRISKRISEVIEPTMNATSEFRQMVIESDLSASHWIFPGSNQNDQVAMMVIHKHRYPELRSKLETHSAQLSNSRVSDSLNKEFNRFEELMGIEMQIMNTLNLQGERNETEKRSYAERQVESVIQPRTDELVAALSAVMEAEKNTRENAVLELGGLTTRFSEQIVAMMITIIFIGIFLSNYLSRIITTPISNISRIVNKIGNGILEKIDWKESKDEISVMVSSINNLSARLRATALFAKEIGNRNFNMQFEPLSGHDLLGNSLISMRDNLKSSEERLNESQHIAALGNWECDMELKFHWSQEMYSILDYQPYEIKPTYKDFINSICTEDKNKLLGLMTKCLNEGISFTLESKIKTIRNNVKNVTIQAKVSEGSGQKIRKIIGIMQDISEQKKVEEELLENNAELKKSNMELDKFVYSVSHDLRAPLSSMLGVVELSEDETQEPVIVEHLKFLKGSIKRLDTFILDILDYSRNSRLDVKKEEINFSEMLQEITHNLKYMNGNSSEVDIQIHIGKERPFYSDKNRLSVVLNNLISNAIRYQNPESDKCVVDINVDTSDTETNIVVKDNGIGISRENHDKIFEMFYRISEKSVGSGMGLYIVKEIVDKLEGKIEVDSEPGKGTAFILHFPN